MGRRKFVVKKAIFYIVTWFFGISIDFVMPRLIPWDIMSSFFYTRLQMLQYEPAAVAQQMYQAIVQEFGLYKYQEPLYIQYINYLKDLLELRFGPSFSYFPTTVNTLIAQAAPWTILIVYPAVVAAFVGGVFMGRFAAIRRGSAWDYAVVAALMFLNTFPVFVTGEILIYVLSVKYHVFPLGEPYNIYKFTRPVLSLPFIESVLYHAVLPTLSLTLFSLAGWVLGMRNNMIPILQEDFMNYYRAMGVPERVVRQRAFRTALLPNFTGFTISLAYAILGSLTIETLFNYAGLGYLFSVAVGGMDYPLLNGLLFMLVTLMTVTGFIAEALSGIIDPRTSREEVEGL